MTSTSTHPLFDRVVMVDWSANSAPKRGRDSIWIAVGTPSAGVEHIANPPTRSLAMSWLVDLLSTTIDERVLVGFDFSFGYPAGFAPVLTGEPHAGWREVWDWLAAHISDDDHNGNDRFDVMARVNERLEAAVGSAPFWGYPGRSRDDMLQRRRPATYEPFAEFRLVEQRLRAAGFRPFSAWQLAYNGSVGSQMLLGMRALRHLVAHPDLGDRLCIWPFDTGVGVRSAHLESGSVLVAEVWPSMLPLRSDVHPVRDAAQMITLVSHVMERDASGALSTWFDPALTQDAAQAVRAEEGWTLGVT